MDKYQFFDALLLQKIGEGYSSFSRLQNENGIQAAAKAIVWGTRRKEFRVVDARLQALRKAGKVTFSSKTGWACA